MAERVVVIGAGPGGYPAAIRAAQLGAEVVLVETGTLGGTCLHWGCIPTKTLKASADALETAHRLAEFGIQLQGAVEPDMAAMMARKDKVVQDQAKGIEKLLASHGVELVWGRGSLTAPDLVEVALNQGGSRQIKASRVILATGSRPSSLPGLEVDGKVVINSDHALTLQEVPKRLLVVGGGVIGCEFAFIMSALGSQVTVVEALDRLIPIPSLDNECSKLLLREMKKRRIKAHLGMVVSGCRVEGSLAKLSLEASPLVEHGKKAPKPMELEADMVLVSVGRAVNSDGLGLKRAGMELGSRGEVVADNRLATNLEGVYAIGDLLGTSRPMLAHMASAEAMAAAANALGGDQKADYRVVPAVAFTSPEVAWVGLSPEQAEQEGIEARSDSFMFRMLGKSQAMGEIAGQCKLLSEKAGGKLLGAHIIGPHAGDLIHECALGLRLGATVGDMAHTIHAHPTLSEAVYEAAESALGLCVHAAPVKA